MKKLIITLLCCFSLSASGAINFYEWNSEPTLIGGNFYTMFGGVTPPAYDPYAPWLAWEMWNSNSPATVVTDYSGEGYDGTNMGTDYIEGTNGMLVGAGHYETDGYTEYLNATNDVSYPATTNSLTVTYWMRSDNWDYAGIGYVVGLTPIIGSSAFPSWSLGAGGNFAAWGGLFAANGSASDKTADDSFESSEGRWVQIVNVFEYGDPGFGNRTNTFYNNMVYQPTAVVGMLQNYDNPPPTVKQVVMGRRQDGWSLSGMDGGMWGLRIYTNALPYAVLQSNYLAEASQLGIISDYLASNTNTYWQTHLAWSGRNIIQDGSPANLGMTTPSSPSAVGTVSNGMYLFSAPNRVLVDSYMEVADTNYTWSCWASNSVTSAEVRLLADNTANFGMLLKLNSGGTADRVGILTGFTGGDISFTYDGLDLNQWRHYAITSDETLGTVTLYIDGVERASGSSSGTWEPYAGATTYIRIGSARNGGSSYFNGLLNEVWSTKTVVPSNTIYEIFSTTGGTH